MRTRGLTLPRNCYFACSPGFTGSVALSMPLGLIAGRLFNPFRRAISARCSPTIFSRAATLPRSSTSSASSSGRLRSEKDGGGGTSTEIVPHQARVSEKCSTAQGFAPITLQRQTLCLSRSLLPYLCNGSRRSVALGRSSDLASGEMAAERCLSLFSEMLATFYLVGFVQLVEAQIK